MLVLEQDEVVLKAVGAKNEIVAVGFKVEYDAGRLINTALDALEAQTDFPVAKIVDSLRHGEGEIGVGLHVVQKLGVPLAIKSSGFVGETRGRLPTRPLAAVDHQYLPSIFGNPDHPAANYGLEACGFRSDGLLGEVEQGFTTFGRRRRHGRIRWRCVRSRQIFHLNRQTRWYPVRVRDVSGYGEYQHASGQGSGLYRFHRVPPQSN